MLSTVLFISLAFVAMAGDSDPKSQYPPDEEDTADTFCENDENGTGVETFASSFYSSIVEEFGFDVVAGIEVPGIQVAMTEYRTIYEIFSAAGACNAAEVAFTASLPFVSLKTVPLAVYLEKNAHDMADFVYDKGLLDCSTAVPLVFDFYKLVSRAFKGLDPNSFASYQRAINQGVADFIKEHGLPLEDSLNDLLENYLKEFKYRANKCKKSEN